jgi:uncharacterized protein (TIGR04442 family)
MTTLLEGIDQVQREQQTVHQLYLRLNAIDQEERLYLLLLEQVQRRVRNFYSSFATKADQDALRREVVEELKSSKRIKGDVPEEVFQQVIQTLQKEATYLQTLLPKIVATKDAAAREQFLASSGLDRFYVEELEREYYENNGLDLEELYQIRQGLS